jgi:hypothetical protein
MERAEHHDQPRRMKQALTVVALGFATALTFAAAAGAAGGTSIAAAPSIQPGVQQIANTALDSTSPGDEGIGQLSGCWHDLEWWRVSLTAGDDVVIKGGATDSGENLLVAVFPPGTTAANVGKAKAVRYGLPLSKALEFTAPSTGAYPVAAGPNCYNGTDGPFAFAVTVTHGVAPQAVVALARTATVPSSGAITATVRSSGTPVTDAGLVLRLYGTWKGTSHLLGTASPKGGTARFAFHLPAGLSGTPIQLRVTGQNVTSRPIAVKIG